MTASGILESVRECRRDSRGYERAVAKIFISYQRGESASPSGRIYDHLVARFGRKNVFKDVDDIPVGVNFASYIQQSLLLDGTSLGTLTEPTPPVLADYYVSVDHVPPAPKQPPRTPPSADFSNFSIQS